MAAPTPVSRARFARRGLSVRGPIDRTTQAMLLRQLYMSHFETRRFARARAVALQAIELEVLSDVIHHDAARAAFADGDFDAAVAHLRTAVRRAPASRRAFHLWTLGGTLFLVQRHDEAAAAFTRAIRWATRDRPLYRAHLALSRLAAGERVPARELQRVIDELAGSPCGQGYGRFVLGHLAYATGNRAAARRYLESFVERTRVGRTAMGIALEGEVEMAQATLDKMAAN